LGLDDAGGSRDGAEVVDREAALLVVLNILLEQLLLVGLDLLVV